MTWGCDPILTGGYSDTECHWENGHGILVLKNPISFEQKEFALHTYKCTINLAYRMSGSASQDGGLGNHMGGGSGGYLEHVMRYAVSQIHGSSVDSLQYKTLR